MVKMSPETGLEKKINEHAGLVTTEVGIIFPTFQRCA
jgi:hypothetical protein